MKDFLKQYENPNEERINYGLVDRTNDDDLIDYIVNSCKSLEVLKYIEFLGYDYVDDEKNIDLNEYITTRKKSKKKDDTRYMHLKDSRYVELHLKFRLRCKGETDVITKKILVPRAGDDGYYSIKGKKYFMLYQLVDASTYTNRQNLTLKSLMPVTVKRNVKEYADSTGEIYTAPTYMIYLFKKEIDVLLFYFAKIGVTKTLEYFSVDKVMRFVETERDTENCIYFPISSKIILEVDKHFFLKHQYVQSVTFMILNIVTNRLRFSNLDSKEYWIERIGSLNATSAYNYYERGMNTLTYFDRMLDETTKKILKLHDPNKKNIYSVVRWMIQNFNDLRKKDNLDLANKRLRCNEYIASLLTKAFSERVNRIIGLGQNRVSLDKVKEIFKFQGDIILQHLYKSGLLRFDDRINDMDFFSKLKFTLKGPNSLGGKNDNNIAMKYRGIHPSFLGKIDINVCGTSDPGSSGVITPFCKTDGLYFDGSFESEGSIFDFEKEANQYHSERSDKMVVNLYSKSNDVSDLFKIKETMANTMKEISIKKVSYKDNLIINIELDEDDGI